jgi:hypothetical protein
MNILQVPRVPHRAGGLQFPVLVRRRQAFIQLGGVASLF